MTKQEDKNVYIISDRFSDPGSMGAKSNRHWQCGTCPPPLLEGALAPGSLENWEAAAFDCLLGLL